MSPEDAKWIDNVAREMHYNHWTESQRYIFALVLKWWFQAHGLPVPVEYA